MELGIYTFAETTPDPSTGHTISAAQRLRDLVGEIELADQVGWTSSASASTTAPTSRFPRLPSC